MALFSSRNKRHPTNSDEVLISLKLPIKIDLIGYIDLHPTDRRCITIYKFDFNTIRCLSLCNASRIF